MQPQPTLEQAHALERAWMRDQAHAGGLLDGTVRSVYGYALRLAALKELKVDDGWIDLEQPLADYRRQLLDVMWRCSVSGWAYPEAERQHGIGTLAWEGSWRMAALKEALPAVARCLYSALCGLYRTFPNLDESHIERVLCEKKLVLALGGGGGTGFVHLCLFQCLEENNIQPSLITGTSIGALLGYVRCLQTHYDAAMIVLKLPGMWQVARSLSPCFGAGVHGLMGMCRIDLNNVLENFVRSLGWSRPPTFQELKIPFGCVASGILLKTGIAHTLEYQSHNPIHALLGMAHFSWRRALSHAAHIASVISSHNAVIPVTFGFDELTSSMLCHDGISFSMLVPGVLNYELPKHHYKSQEILKSLFERDRLYRLCDGGLASNVPVRSATMALKQHLGHENAYILGMDVFAPQPGDGIFFPLQQVANANAIVDARYADSFVRLKYLLSPMNIAPALMHHQWLNTRFKKSFAPEMQVIQFALAPLQPLSSLDLIGF